ncbi:mechanosensitive ion channel family protein [Pseudahrensia aquimaris]|uniref:Mechanosensitive ion channel family protein n=1 Tax=Pseudahrensia aquimaris TaxID=744461 RepID=A0ABW3F937_9HYPH
MPRLFALFICTILWMPILSDNAQAQLMPGMGQSKSSGETDDPAMDAIMKSAKESGSTVIVIRPEANDTQSTDVMANLRAKRFLEVRGRIERILSSGAALWPNMLGTLNQASPEGGRFWIVRALLTAFGGMFVGWLCLRPLINWSRERYRDRYKILPETTADKAKFLLTRVAFALSFAVILYVVSLLVALIFDPRVEPARRLIFELLTAYFVYRVLRYVIGWNLMADDAPQLRIVNLTDDEAKQGYTDWYRIAVVAVTLTAIGRWFGIMGQEQLEAGLTAGLTADNIKLLQFIVAALILLLLIGYTLKNRKAASHMFAPSDANAAFYKLRTNLARLFPAIVVVYSVASFAVFMYRSASDVADPGLVLFAPFAIFYIAIVVFGLVLIAIQTIYQRREKKFAERAAIARSEQQASLEETEAALNIEAGEEMIAQLDAPQFEYQPIFRSFFETAAMAIIASVALGELARVWGVPVGDDGNPWAAFLDIVLAMILCWLAYQAVSIFIDKRLEEEGGVPVDGEEAGGEGGGAGASRMATLLPIFGYVMTAVIFASAIMIILSRMGFDIGPIFAGAGVVGIAVGFGAQTLIRDIFSGAFFLLDDAFRKGEYVEIEGIKGTVEKISIRSFQLRHHLGALHTIPFGEIRHLTNYSRDWVLMKLPLRVTYDTDTEKVRKLVKKLGQELLNHPQVGHTFMQPLKSQGVYKMEDSAMIIRVKFMTKPGEQFVTRKVVYESIQDLFAREGIHFAHKEVTVRLADGKDLDELSDSEKQAVSAAARSVIDADEEALAAAGGAKGSGSDR